MLATALAGCGGSSKPGVSSHVVRGEGFTVGVPAGWRLGRAPRTTTARDGAKLVSVTVFPLVKRYDPAMFATIVPELDGVARQLAARERATLSRPRTERIAGRDARVYELTRGSVDERIGFVLAGRREYQLYCRPIGDACDLLFSSFSLAARA